MEGGALALPTLPQPGSSPNPDQDTSGGGRNRWFQHSCWNQPEVRGLEAGLRQGTHVI